MELRLQVRDKDKQDNDIPAQRDAILPKGFKQRPSSKRSRRLRSWVERQTNGRKRLQSRGQPYSQASRANDLPSHIPNEASCSTPPTYELHQAQDQYQFSFTSFLMAPLDTNITTLQ